MEVKWYSIVSVGIVGLALVWSVYVLWRKEVKGKGGGGGGGESQQTGRVDIPLLSHQHQSGCWPDELCLWTSCWRGLHPAFLLVFRILSFLVLAFLLSWDLRDWDASIFFYYTEWTHVLVMIYFAIGSVVSAHGCWLDYLQKDTNSEKIDGSQRRGDLEENATYRTRFAGENRGFSKLQRQCYPEQDIRRVGFFGYVMQIAYQISAGAVVLTDVVFWCIIVPFVSNAHLGLNLLMGCMHTMNIIFLLLDTSINRLPFPWFRLAYFVIWSSGYVIIQWLIHLCGFTWWPYPFLQLSTPLAPLWYLVLAAFHIASYGLYAVILKLKDLLFSKFFPYSYVRSH